MKVRGVTLIEVLTVITITSILAAILYPVIESAKRKSNEAVCISNLHQLDMALELYRTTYAEERADFGTPVDMGLPPWFPRLAQVGLVPPGLLKGCHGESVFPNSPPLYSQSWPPAKEDIGEDAWTQLIARWTPYVNAHGAGSVLLQDLNHMPLRTISPFATQRGIGVYLDGHAKIVTRQGDAANLEWWN